jgi:hypothetical protein
MEFLHLAKLINAYFSSLPEPLKSYAYNVFYALSIFSLAYILYRVARSEQVTESGKIQVAWYKPGTWPSRYIAIKALNQAEAPKGFVEGVEFLRKWLQNITASFLLVLGVFCAGIAILLGVVKLWQFLLAGLVLIVIGVFSLMKKK